MEIQRISEKPPILTTDKGCLALYPYDRWEEFEAKLDAADSLQPEVQAITRFFLANAVEAPIDSQGRILIPRHLRKHASLDRDVTVSGMGKWIEIWGTSALDHELAQTYQNLDGMRNAVVGQGK